MKIYIVTDGCYSDYMIDRVFSNRSAAEEYKKWHNIYNEIEEYEVYDEPFTTTDGEKFMFIRVGGIMFPEAVVNLDYTIRPDIRREGDTIRGCGIMNGHIRPGVFDIYLYRYIPVDKWNEEKYKDKLTKALYDYAAMAKSMFADGASIRDVEQALRAKEIEEI